MDNPMQGIVIGMTGGSVSLWSLMEQGTTIFGFVGSFFGCLLTMGSFYFFVRKILKGRKTSD